MHVVEIFLNCKWRQRTWVLQRSSGHWPSLFGLCLHVKVGVLLPCFVISATCLNSGYVFFPLNLENERQWRTGYPLIIMLSLVYIFYFVCGNFCFFNFFFRVYWYTDTKGALRVASPLHVRVFGTCTSTKHIPHGPTAFTCHCGPDVCTVLFTHTPTTRVSKVTPSSAGSAELSGRSWALLAAASFRQFLLNSDNYCNSNCWCYWYYY